MEELYMCDDCGKILPRKKFYKDKARVNGIKSVCKDCLHKRYISDKEYKIKYQKEWNKDNIDKVKQYSRRYAEKKKYLAI